jgi:NAD(P)-dependent dehydrogenase (short-subunit alcohol dehydrogenase family)
MGALDGRIAVITGASRGIGAATARAMAAEGAAVALLARSGAEIEALADEIAGGGGRALALGTDVGDYAAMEAAIARVTEAFGRVDILVTNAAVIDPIGPLATTDPGEWGRAIAINVTGVYNGMRAVLPGMLRQGGGTLISIGSGAAQNPMEGWSAYCSAKAAVLMLARCAHHELKGKGIRVFSLSPGTIATDMQRAIKASGINPVSRMDFADHAPPEHPAKALVWLCTKAADEYAGTEVSLRDPVFRGKVGL